MKFLLDTNVLVYAANRDAPQHPKALSVVEETLAAGAPWCLSWVNVYEFLRVVTHRRLFPHPMDWAEAWTQILGILDHPSLTILVETDRHPAMLGEVARQVGRPHGVFVHDVHIAALMREHDVRRIVTGDVEFRKFSFLKVENPFL